MTSGAGNISYAAPACPNSSAAVLTAKTKVDSCDIPPAAAPSFGLAKAVGIHSM